MVISDEFHGPTGELNVSNRRHAHALTRAFILAAQEVDMAKAVVGAPRIIMLEEPAGGLASDETGNLGLLILSVHDFCSAQILLIDHDADLVEWGWTGALVMVFARKIAFGPMRAVFQHSDVMSAYLGSAD